jgi:hypothetical protein
VSALHVHLSKLRDLLGDLMVRDTAGYSLLAGGFELDRWQFDALIERARNNPAETRALLRQALGLVRGEPLWGQLMLALYRTGRQPDALDAFTRPARLRHRTRARAR